MAEVYLYNELWDGLQAAGGAITGRFAPVGGTRVRRLTGDNVRQFQIPKSHRLAASFVKGAVVRDILSADGATWQEWIIDRVSKASGVELNILVECVAPMTVLAHYQVTTTDADGYVYSDTPAVQLTPSAIASSFLRSNTPSWITAGTVTPTGNAEVAFSGDSALSGIRRMEEAIPGYEFSLEPNGTTEYRLHQTVLGGSAATLYLRTGKNIQGMRREVVPGQITRLTQISGAPGDDGPSGIAWAYWEVVSTAGAGPYTVVLKSPHGGDGPIAFDNQFNHANLPGGANSLYLEKRDGTRTQITGSSASAQSLTVASITAVTAGDLVRIVASSTGKHLTFLDAPTEIASTGILGGRYESAWDDTVCVVKNALQEVWPSTLPTGWTGSGTKTTTANEWLTSGAAISISGSFSDGGQISAPPAKAWYIRARRTTFSAVAWIRLRGAGPIALQVKANGAVVGSPLVYESPLNAWRQLKLEGLDLSAHVGTTVTLTVEIVKVGAGTANLIVDSINLTDSLTARGVTTGANATRIWQGANDFLRVRCAEQVTYRGSVADLDRMGRSNQQPIVVGGTAVVADDELGTVTARLVELADTPGDPRTATVTYATLPPRFSRAPSKPLALVIPYFEPIAVQTANRDTRNAAQLLKAEITASDETSVTVTLTSVDSLGGSPVISYAVFGAAYSSGSGVGPYVFTKPATGTGLGRAVFTAKLQDRADVYDAVDIPEAEPPTLLAITATFSASDDDSITYEVVAVDPKGTASITITDDGGAASTSLGSDLYELARPAAGDPPLAVKFTASATNRTSQSVSLLVPAQDPAPGGTVPPSIDAFYSTSQDTGADEVNLAWTVSNEPASETYDLYFRLQLTDPSTGTVTDEETGFLSGITSPYALGAGALSGSLDIVTKGTSGWHYAQLWCNLRMKDSGAAVVATAETTVYFYGIYTP